MLLCGLGSLQPLRRSIVVGKTQWRARAWLQINLAAYTCSKPNNKADPLEWPLSRVRSQFVDYFVNRTGHVHFPSSPVVPVNDPTLLFTNAGMNQFKPIFLGTADPSSPLALLKRATNSQKCIRAGGKHNDLEDVGKDTYHHTFFEMLGTWSFGDYFKAEAIDWAFDILVNVYKLPVSRLYVSYFAGSAEDGLPADTESRDHWLRYLPADRVLPFDKKANFWEMGDTGPCGPCSEIHFDRIGGRDAAHLVNQDDPDVLEIWNLVFIQFNRESDGSLRLLPDKHVDTGMGLERLTSILQDTRSNYDTDAFLPLFQAIQQETGSAPYTGKLGAADAAQNFKDTAYRVIADHIRTLSFAIADGAVPSNEGRGYVLRRILRRAVRYGVHTLGADRDFFSRLVPTLIKTYGGAYSELAAKEAEITSTLQEEEQSFASLLERGTRYFQDMETQLKAAGLDTFSGDQAFYLYDTLGFPLDLTQLMAAEKGMKVDLAGFQRAMREQKERSRHATASRKLSDGMRLTFGAEQTAHLHNAGVLHTDASARYVWDVKSSTKVKALFTQQGFHDSVREDTVRDAKSTIGMVLESSPFYPESGGQVADTGAVKFLTHDGSTCVLDVLDVQSYAGYLLHTCALQEGERDRLVGLSIGTRVEAQVDYARRRKVAPNHTMTHVLNHALRKVLGSAVEQKGSQVSEDKLRFDFASKRAMTPQEILEVEGIMHGIIAKQYAVNTHVVPLKRAMEIHGLRAVFGETYPDPVRVVSVGPAVDSLLSAPKDARWIDYSVEFCGGTHISNTAEAEACCVVEETAVAKGVRRISAVTGADARAALFNADLFSKEVAGMEHALQALQDKPTLVVGLDTAEQQLLNLRTRLAGAVISQGTKSLLRMNIEDMHKRLKVMKSEFAKDLTGEGIRIAKTEAERLAKSGQMMMVLPLNIGSTSKAIRSAIEEIKQVHDDISFMGISIEEDKMTVFAVVSETAQRSGFSAMEWVSATLAVCGGKGGGKHGSAQGSADPSKAQRAITEANKYVLACKI